MRQAQCLPLLPCHACSSRDKSFRLISSCLYQLKLLPDVVVHRCLTWGQWSVVPTTRRSSAPLSATSTRQLQSKWPPSYCQTKPQQNQREITVYCKLKVINQKKYAVLNLRLIISAAEPAPPLLRLRQRLRVSPILTAASPAYDPIKILYKTKQI